MSEDKEAKRSLLGKKMYEVNYVETVSYTQIVVAKDEDEALYKFDRDKADVDGSDTVEQTAIEIEWDEDYEDE